MKTITFDNREQWMLARLGKITGSRAGDIISKAGITKEAIVKELEEQKIEFKKSLKKEELEKMLPPESIKKLRKQLDKKKGYYELIAERLAVDDSEFDGYVPNETPMDRGTRLEKFAVFEFEKATGKVVNNAKVIWMRDENESVAISPDGVISDTEAVEIKCLSSAYHIEAWLTQSIPGEYEMQMYQYFVVNDKLQTLYFCFYDPRIPCKPFFYMTFHREEVQEKVTRYLEEQLDILESVDNVVARMTGF